MASESTWRVGALNVPATTGDVFVDLGGTPKAVFFWGANWTDEDTVISGATGHALFRGMAAPDYANPSSTLQNAACTGPTGDQHMIDNYAILNLTTVGSATLLYRASLSSFDADGFTVTFDIAASGGYKVVYAALFDVDNVGAFVGAASQSSLALGFTPGASLLHGAWSGPSASGTDRTQEWYGGAAYAVNESAGAQAFTFPTSFAGQYNIAVQSFAPGTSICQGGSFVGPFLSTSNIISTASGTNVSFNGDGTNGGMIVAWDDNDSAASGHTLNSSLGGTSAVTGLPFAPGLVVGYSVSNEAPGQGTGARGALGFSVISSDFQWAALVEEYFPGYTTFGTGRGAIQSFTNGIIQAIDDASYVAGTVALTDDGFVSTTTVNDITPGAWTWQAFGHPKVFSWLPHIYRRIIGGGQHGLIRLGRFLFEDGSQILLEDGSGYLRL